MQGIRNAKIEDSVTIYEVIKLNSVNGQLLMVPLNEIRKHISDFIVFVKEDTIVGCGRIYRYNNKISEICSLSVIEEMKGIGIGKAIIDRLIEKAQTPIIFLVTEKPDYYIKGTSKNP
jgi:N-acetylglutamate synthase-like GNAT family acetyltransferase